MSNKNKKPISAQEGGNSLFEQWVVKITKIIDPETKKVIRKEVERVKLERTCKITTQEAETLNESALDSPTPDRAIMYFPAEEEKDAA